MSAASPPVAYGHAGRLFDGAIGLYWNRDRDFDPGTGEFPTPDRGWPYDHLNTYVYALNNPLVYIDSDGFDAKKRNSVRSPVDEEGPSGGRGGSPAGGSPSSPRGPSTPTQTPETCSRPFTPDQDALIQLGKDARRNGINPSEADILRKWAGSLEFHSVGLNLIQEEASVQKIASTWDQLTISPPSEDFHGRTTQVHSRVRPGSSKWRSLCRDRSR